jgi:hypothetical protein
MNYSLDSYQEHQKIWMHVILFYATVNIINFFSDLSRGAKCQRFGQQQHHLIWLHCAESLIRTILSRASQILNADDIVLGLSIGTALHWVWRPNAFIFGQYCKLNSSIE